MLYSIKLKGRFVGRYLAIDYGDVRIGLALSDPFKIIS